MELSKNCPTIDRRGFLTASLFSLFPIRLHAKFKTNPDVVIVGGGAAGIAAAHALQKTGLSAVLVEAADHLGGRVHTERATFGIPFDVGAHWIHSGKLNPYQNIAKNLGFELYPARSDFRIFTEDREATNAEAEDFWKTYLQISDAIEEAGEQGRDVAASEVIKDIAGIWSATAKFAIGPWDMAKNMEDFSTLDWWNFSDVESDYYCAEGFGSIVAEYGKGVEASVNTKVKKIDWNGNNVRVDTDQGSIDCRAVIVTVSTGVLAGNEIDFVPSLPLDKRESFDAVSMGIYDHIALQFSEDVFGMGNDGYVLFEIGEYGKGFGTLTNASGSGIAYCDVGGNWARELQWKSTEYRVDYALSELKKILGNDIEKHFVKGTATSWGTNALTHGSYASARPGAYHLRTVLRQPVGDKIFFAGEACHRSLWATVAGAHLSGVEAAGIVSRQLASS